MDYKSYRMKKREVLLVFAIVEAACLVGGILFYDSWIIVFAGPAIYLMVARKRYCEMKLKQKSLKLRAGFKDMLYSLSSSYLAGRHMREAMHIAREELKQMYEDHEPIMEELERMNSEMSQPEKSERIVLREFSIRSGLEDVEDFTSAYSLMVRSGGDMASMMNRCAGIIGEKISAEEEIREMVSQRKSEGLMITVMPVVVILFLRLTSPGYLRVMYDTLPGILVMTGVIIIIYLAYRAMERITSIDV